MAHPALPIDRGDLHVPRVDLRNASPDLALAALAGRQRGVVTAAQLRGLGIGRGAVADRLAKGRLHRIHKGVYAVGHRALAPLAREMAALLACGSGALLSHRSAAGVWGFADTPDRWVELTVVGRDCGARPGIRRHCVRMVDPVDVTARLGLAVTRPERTLVDLAGSLSEWRLQRAVDEALVLKLVSHDGLRAAVDRSRGRPGVRRLRVLLDRLDGPTFSRSEAERRMLRLIDTAGLPTPETNVRVGP